MADFGRPTKFSDDLKPICEKLYSRGFTDGEVAEIIGVTEQTINNWKKKHPDFFESIIDWKLKADERVEKALYERAIGYEHEEDKIFNDQGTPLIVPTIKHYPPDTQAASLWLRNRKPDKWRDTKNMEHSGKDGKGLVINISSEDAGLL